MKGVIDMNVVEELLDLTGDRDPELFIDLVTMFLEDGPARVDTILKCLAKGDLEGMERAAHNLKGSAGNLGATEIQALAEVLQVASRNRDLSRASAEAGRLPELFSDAEADFRELLEQYS